MRRNLAEELIKYERMLSRWPKAELEQTAKYFKVKINDEE